MPLVLVAIELLDIIEVVLVRFLFAHTGFDISLKSFPLNSLLVRLFGHVQLLDRLVVDLHLDLLLLCVLFLSDFIQILIRQDACFLG